LRIHFGLSDSIEESLCWQRLAWFCGQEFCFDDRLSFATKLKSIRRMNSNFIHLVPLWAVVSTYGVCRLIKLGGMKFIFSDSKRVCVVRKQITLIFSLATLAVWHFLVLFRQLFPMEHTTVLVEIILLIFAICQGYTIFLHTFIPVSCFDGGDNLEKKEEEKTCQPVRHTALQIEDEEDDHLEMDLEARLNVLRQPDRRDGAYVTIENQNDRVELLQNMLRYSAIPITPENVRFLTRSALERNRELNDP